MPRSIANSLALLILGVLLTGCDKSPETPPSQRNEVVQKSAPGSDPAAQSPDRTVEHGTPGTKAP